MADPVRIVGGNIDDNDNEGIQAQVDAAGNLHVTQGGAPGLNQAYEDASFEAGDSPATLDFNNDASRNAMAGWIICDGDGDIQVDFSRNGVNFGEKFTMKLGEMVNLRGLSIDKLRITHTGTDSAYRVFLV